MGNTESTLLPKQSTLVQHVQDVMQREAVGEERTPPTIDYTPLMRTCSLQLQHSSPREYAIIRKHLLKQPYVLDVEHIDDVTSVRVSLEHPEVRSVVHMQRWAYAIIACGVFLLYFAWWWC